MNILKKITGVLVLLIAALLSFGTLMSIFGGINDSIKEIKKSTTMGISYAFGSLVGAIILVAIIYYIIKLGLKLIKGKSPIIDSIEDIGI